MGYKFAVTFMINLKGRKSVKVPCTATKVGCKEKQEAETLFGNNTLYFRYYYLYIYFLLMYGVYSLDSSVEAYHLPL